MVRANKRNEALRIESALLNKIAMLGTEKTAEAVGVDKSQISRWKRDWIPKFSMPSAQVGSIVNCMFNRDCMTHTHINFIGSGLPLKLQREVAKELFGSEDAYDETKNYTPINDAKIKYAKWSLLRVCLHNAVTLCNWVWPMTVSPLKSRNYRGDLALEAKFSAKGWLKLVTGLFDNSAGVTQAQSLEIRAGQGVRNQQGHLSSLGGDNRIVTADFDNQGGGLYASGLLSLDGQRFLNQGAAAGQGGKVGAGRIDFSLAGALANRFGQLEAPRVG